MIVVKCVKNVQKNLMHKMHYNCEKDYGSKLQNKNKKLCLMKTFL